MLLLTSYSIKAIRNITKYNVLLLIVSSSLQLFTLSGAQTGFGNQIDKCLLPINLDEISGIAPAKVNKNKFWIHNDSGDEPRVFLLNENWSIVSTFYLKGTKNRDWEDIATGFEHQSGKNYVFVGEIGDNSAQYDEKSIIRFEEPQTTDIPAIDSTITKFDVLRFRYPDGNRDAETLLFDPLSSDLFIVSKREDSVRVYRFAYPQSKTAVTTIEHITTLPMSGVVGGDISPDGTEILLKNYTNVFYWKRENSESLTVAFSRSPQKVAYTPEPQGEAICWTNNATGYITVSEQSPLRIQSHLYFYPRTQTKTNEDTKNESNQLLKISYGNNGLIHFIIRTKTGDFTTVEIHDLEGRVIKTLFNDKATDIELQCSWEAIRGTYFCVVKTSLGTFSEKFIY